MYEIGYLVGALVPTFLISRLLLWIMRSWDGRLTRLAVVHVFSWIMISFVGGIGGADGGAFAGAQAAMTYAAPQAFWFLVDIVRMKVADRRRLRAAAS